MIVQASVRCKNCGRGYSDDVQINGDTAHLVCPECKWYVNVYISATGVTS